MPNDVDRPLAGKVAVVTGGGRNIGREIVLALARDGAAVVVGAGSDADAARAVAEEATAAGGRGLAHLADVTDEAAVKGLADAAIDAFGRIDILVNNAALRRQVPLVEMTLAEWREIMGVILDGSFLCARACVPHMIAAGGGAIVNLGGIAAHVGVKNRAHVISAKAGLIGLTKALAVELAEHGITANCVVPGTIDTARGASAGKTPSFRASSLIDRLGRPEEIAAMVHYLCSPAARYITGQTLHVSGGRFLP